MKKCKIIIMAVLAVFAVAALGKAQKSHEKAQAIRT